MARDFFARIRGVSRERFAGVIDFSYQHYALGDALTSQVNIACLALERGCAAVDLYLIIDPEAPADSQQRYINTENYWTSLDNLFPAFLCSPMVRSIRLIRDPASTGLTLLSLAASRVPMWPAFMDQLRRRMTFPMGHEIIDGFFHRHGYLPTLAAPRGYGAWVHDFVRRNYPGRFLVCINPRQSRLTYTPATTYRDAALPEWYEFLGAVGRKYPDVHFFMLGGFLEWEHTLLAYQNVTIPRAMGLTLAHELALLHASDLFMGTSSGFATMATFSQVPYVITDFERSAAPMVGLQPDAERYPFAQKNQCLVWRREDAKLLLDYFHLVYDDCRGQHSARQSAAPLAGTQG
jgi:hypothetical protein